MFANKKVILFITKSKITVSGITIDNKPKEKIIGQFDWTPYTLVGVLLRIKEIAGSNIRILLSEDFVYVVHITLPMSTNVNKDMVRQKAQELIPEDLNETVWDFKEIIKPSPSFLNSKSSIQVVAVVKTLFEQLSKSFIKAGFHIETIEPLSYSLGRFTKNQKNPFLFVYVTDEILLTLTQKEIVFATQRLNYISQTSVNQFLAFAKEKFSLEIKNVIFCGNTKSIDVKQFSNVNVKAEIQNVNPAISLALKEDIKGKDEDILNLELIRIFHKQNSSVDSNANTLSDNSISSKKKFPKKIIILAGGIAAIIAVGGIIVYKNKSLTKIENPPIVISPSIAISAILPTLSSAPTATSTAKIDLSKYTIAILNGTGKANDATKADDLLKNDGFNVVKTGNAETFDYKKTEVHYKKTVPIDLILLLDKSLKTLYDFSIGKSLEEKEDTDILIIIGKSTKE